MSNFEEICRHCIHEGEKETYCNPLAYNHYCPEFQFFEPKCCGNCGQKEKRLITAAANGFQIARCPYISDGENTDYCSK